MRYTIYQYKSSGRYFYVYNGTPKLVSRASFNTIKDLVETDPSLELFESFLVPAIEVASCNQFSDLHQTHPELFI